MHDRIQDRAEIRGVISRRGTRLDVHFLEHFHRRRRAIRRLAGQQKMQRGPQPVNVRSEADAFLIAHRLFAGHVTRRAHDHSGCGQVIVIVRVLGESEVCDFDHVFV